MLFSSLFSWNTLIVIVSVLTVLYFYLIRNFSYWKNRGIDGPKPYAGLGTMYQMFSRDMFTNSSYNVEKYGKVYGAFVGDRPNLVIADPELIKDITIKDFHLFVDRDDLVTGEPMNDRSLFNLFGDEWKKMRSIISPTFSSGKMRKMHPIIIDCVKTLESNLDKSLKTSNEVDVKKFMSNFTIDVIASCAFGTKIDTYSEIKSQFVINSQKAFRGTWRLWVFFTLAFISPRLIQLFKFQFVEPSVTNFFKSAIRSIISRREEEEKGKHNDYIQLMINARDLKQNIDENEQDDDSSEQLFRTLDDKQTIKNTTFKGGISEDDILATSFVFFVAGFETTAATLSNMFHSLATDEDIQQKLYEEIQRYGPNFSYEDVSRMPYLEACVAETLRLYNPLAQTSRLASEDYKLGDTGITIEKGTIINLDLQTLHHSSEYYEEPTKFNPERFLPENRDKLTPYTYMPFGMGPRNCVGMRFALMEAKTAAAILINKYRFFKTANTKSDLKSKKFEIIFTVGEVPIGLELRNKLN